jgi:hypothetical protein
VKLRGNGTVDDNSVAAPAPARAGNHHGGSSGPGADDTVHHGNG